MTKIQYCGLSDYRTLLATETIKGVVPSGIGVNLMFNAANNWIIDFTVAPYTGCAAGTAAALIALPNGEFKDVTATSATQWGSSEYGKWVGAPANALSTPLTQAQADARYVQVGSGAYVAPSSLVKKATMGDQGTVKPFTIAGAPAGGTGHNGLAGETNAAVVTIAAPTASGTYYGLAHAALLTAGPRAGQVMAIWRQGTSEATGQGTVQASFSTDQGVTWSSAIQVASDGTYDCRTGGIVQLADGRVVVTFTRNTVGAINHSFLGSTSFATCPAGSDPGTAGNWTTSTLPTTVGPANGFDNGIAPLVETTPGTVVQAIQVPVGIAATAMTYSGTTVTVTTASAHGFATGDYAYLSGFAGSGLTGPTDGATPVTYINNTQFSFTVGTAPSGTYSASSVTVLSNTLGGQSSAGYVTGTYTGSGAITWGTYTAVASAAGKSYQEVHLAVTKTGKWVLAIRDQSDYSVLVYTSTNQGGTWTAGATLNYVYSSPRVTCMADGTVVILSRYSPSQKGDWQAQAGARFAVVYSLDDAVTWTPVEVDTRTGQVWYDYGGLVEVTAGLLLCVYATSSSIASNNGYSEVCARYLAKVGVTDPAGGVHARGITSTDGDLGVRGGTLRVNGAGMVYLVTDDASGYTGTASGFPEMVRTVDVTTEGSTPPSATWGRALQFPLETGPKAVPAKVSFPALAGTFSGACTAECRYFHARGGNQQTLMGKWGDTQGASTLHWTIYTGTSGQIICSFRNSGGSSVTITSATFALTVGSWYSVAMQWDGSATLALWLNGASVNTAALSAILAADTVTPFTIGATAAGTNVLVGDVQEVRLSTVARYTAGSAYTPATKPFTTDTNTQLLAHGNRIVASL